MIWPLERQGQRITCEIRREEDGNGYEFVRKGADGAEQVERFDDPSALLERTLDVFRELREQGWSPPAAS